MRKTVRGIGILWMGAMVAIGVWLGFAGLFGGKSGILFESGFGDIWILAIAGLPGYFLWKWGGAAESDQEH